MSSLSTEKLEELRDALVAGILKVCQNQQWSHQGVTYTRANLTELQSMLDWAEKQISRQARGGPRVRGVMPV